MIIFVVGKRQLTLLTWLVYCFILPQLCLSDQNGVSKSKQTLNMGQRSDQFEDDSVIHIDYTTFNDEILRKKTANFVYFNIKHANCRHCTRFANIWKDLALDIRWWKSTIRLLSIDCDEDDNFELCKRAGATEFPQVRFYWLMADSIEKSVRIKLFGKSTHTIRHMIVDIVLKYYNDQQRQYKQTRTMTPTNPLLAALNLKVSPIPDNWPELEPIEAKDSQKMLTLLPVNQQRGISAVLIMESNEYTFLGPEILLDLNPYSNVTYVARVADNQGDVCKSLLNREDVNVPALIYISPKREAKLIMAAPKYTNDEELRKSFVRSFERKYIRQPVRRVWSAEKSSSAANEQANSGMGDGDSDTKIDNHVHMNDLTNAIRASLTDQVYRHQELSDDQYNALIKYVYLLQTYFPFEGDSAKFIKNLYTWLMNQVSPMDIYEYKKQFHDLNEYLPKKEWISCRSLVNSEPLPESNLNNISLDPASISRAMSNISKLMGNQGPQLRNILKNIDMEKVMKNPNSLSEVITTSLKQAKESFNGTNNVMLDILINKVSSISANGGPNQESSLSKLLSMITGRAIKEPKVRFSREYPCSMWLLSHVLVMSEYVKDSPRKDVKHLVLPIMRAYASQFFSCPSCGNRVSEVSAEFKFDLREVNFKEQTDSILLLWKIHNRINKRLESEVRIGVPQKIQFPSESQCPKCRQPKVPSEALTTPNWHEKQVINFLYHYYKPQSIKTSDDDSSASLFTSSWQLIMLSFIIQTTTMLFIFNQHQLQ